ncbi:hypothetical protein MKX03_026793, partial [Papaver bracteatum]
ILSKIGLILILKIFPKLLIFLLFLNLHLYLEDQNFEQNGFNLDSEAAPACNGSPEASGVPHARAQFAYIPVLDEELPRNNFEQNGFNLDSEAAPACNDSPEASGIPHARAQYTYIPVRSGSAHESAYFTARSGIS